AGSGRGPGVRPLDPADVLQVRLMPAPIESEDRCGGIVEPDLAEDPFLRLADRGEDFRRGLEERLRIDQGAGHGDLRRPMAVVAQPLRDVVDEGESGPAGEDRHFGREDFHVERRPVLLAVAPETDHAVVRLEDPQGFAEPRGVLLQADVLEGHRQEFGPRIAVLLDRRVVHVEEPEGLQVEHPHRQGVLLEQESIGLRFGAGTSLPALLVRIRRSPRDGDLARTGKGLESTKPARRPRFPIKAESLMISREMSAFGNLLTGLVPRSGGRTQDNSEPSPFARSFSCHVGLSSGRQKTNCSILLNWCMRKSPFVSTPWAPISRRNWVARPAKRMGSWRSSITSSMYIAPRGCSDVAMRYRSSPSTLYMTLSKSPRSTTPS